MSARVSSCALLFALGGCCLDVPTPGSSTAGSTSSSGAVTASGSTGSSAGTATGSPGGSATGRATGSGATGSGTTGGSGTGEQSGADGGCDCDAGWPGEPGCDAVGRCVRCSDDSQCNGYHCDLDPENWLFGSCQECRDDGDCDGGVCDPDFRACDIWPDCRVAGGTVCGSDAGSLFGLQFPICDSASGACVICEQDSDCQQEGYALCDTASKDCVACLGPSDCPSDQPGCYLGRCDLCGAGVDCPNGMRCVLWNGPTFFDVPVGSCVQ